MADREFVEEAVCFPSGALELEGVLAYPAEGTPRARVLLLAPHPHLGGSMENNVVLHLARRAAEEGCACLRFNYRGVGGSGIALTPGTSLYDHWEAMEREQRYGELLPDARAALAFLTREVQGPETTALVGYSLGAILAGMLAAVAGEPTRLVCVSPPVAKVALDAHASVAVPKLFVAGDRDFAFDTQRFAAELARLPGPKLQVRLPGCDHFFRREEERVWRVVAPFLLDAPRPPAHRPPRPPAR